MVPSRTVYLPLPRKFFLLSSLSEECSNGVEGARGSTRQSKITVSLELRHLWCHGGDNGARTHGLWLAKPSLFQLSYVPKEGGPVGRLMETGPPCNEGERVCPIGAGSGGRTRTGGLLVMGQASYRCSTPRYMHGPTYRAPGQLFTTSQGR